MVIMSQQYFLYRPTIFIPMNAKNIPAPTRHPHFSFFEIMVNECLVSVTSPFHIHVYIYFITFLLTS